MIRIGIIGLGGLGILHAGWFQRVRGCRVVAAADVSPAAIRAASKRLPRLRLSDRPRDVTGAPDIDAVVIATPTLLHKAPAIDALKAGKHVLCEKPMARTVADCRRMIDASRRAKKLLMVAHCRRFDRYWGRFADMVKRGTLGRPLLWRTMSANKGPGRWFMDDHVGGGPLFDAAVHNYDFANMIFGAPADVLSASVNLDPSASAMDTATTIIRYQSGDQLMLSWSWAGGRTHVEDVVGPNGSLIFGPGPMTPPPANDGSIACFCHVNGAGRQKLIRFKYDPEQMYLDQARHFIDCVTGKVSECRSPAREALNAVAVGEAVLKTAVRGGVRRIEV